MYRSAKALKWPGKRGFAEALQSPVKLTPEATDSNSKTVRLRHSTSKVTGASYVEYTSSVDSESAVGTPGSSKSKRTLAFARIDKSSSRPSEEQPGVMVAVLRHFFKGE
jgi:hypothetical protein